MKRKARENVPARADARLGTWKAPLIATMLVGIAWVGPVRSQDQAELPQSVRVLKLEREKRVNEFVDDQKARYLAGLEKLRTDWVAQNRVEDALVALELRNTLEETSDLELSDAEIVALPNRLKKVVETWRTAIEKEITEANAALVTQLDAIRVNAIKKGDLELVRTLETEIEGAKKLGLSMGPPDWKVVEISDVPGLSAAESAIYPWITADGLMFLWEQKGGQGPEIWQSSRTGLSASWSEPHKIADGRHPAVSRNGKEMLYFPAPTSPGTKIHFATRSHITESFGSPVPLPEFSEYMWHKSPWISGDGSLVVLQAGRPKCEFYLTKRNPDADTWGPPELIRFEDRESLRPGITWPFLSADRKQLWFSNDGDQNAQLAYASRETTDEAFDRVTLLEFEGKPVFGRSPRLLISTRELYFTARVGEKEWRLKRAVLEKLPSASR